MAAVSKTKDYAAIAAKAINKPTDTKRYPKILIYARNKKGKTTFGISAGVDKTLVIDPERGTDEMKTTNPNRWQIERWEELDDIYNYLRYSEHPYQWIVLDGLTKINNMALKHVMRVQEERSLDRIPGFVQKQDYGKSGELMKDLLTRFHNLPYGVIFTAQERMEIAGGDSEEDSESEEQGVTYIPDLPKAVRGSVNSIVDVIGRLYVIKNDEDKRERRLWIEESVKYDTGYRSDYTLPTFVKNPTIPKLVRLIRTGRETAPKPAAAK
jgi:phage nucleotide-binding protein